MLLNDVTVRDFFERLLAHLLTPKQFEQCVAHAWALGGPRVHAPSSAAWLHRLAQESATGEAGYGQDADGLFSSRWLAGRRGHPGAIHIQAAPERRKRSGLDGLNRTLHRHDSGRIGLLTSGRATFHVVVEGRLQSWPVSAGDLIAWPAWTDHTFDAQDGFSLVSAMADYVSPAADGFSFPPGEAARALALAAAQP